MTPQEAGLLKQIEATYPHLEGWFARTATHAEQPQKGSDLFEDDKAFAFAPISEVARLSLALSVEHLRMIRVVIDAHQLFPSATFTTMRGALVGAAQAVWILGPDERALRCSRGLTVLAQQFIQLRKFYDEVDRLGPGSVPESQWSWIRERIDQLAQVRGEPSPTLIQTTMIEIALAETFPSNAGKQRSGRLLWRQMSSDAHVLPWGVAQRSSVRVPQGKGRSLAVLSAEGDLKATAEAYLCAYELVRRGWSLFDRRCEAA